MTIAKFLVALGVAVLSVAPAAAQAPANPVAHWKLDEQTGTTAVDASGRGHHGTITGGAAYTTTLLAPVPGNVSALTLDGTGQVTVPDAADLNFTSQDAMTLSVWFMLTSDMSTYHIVGKRDGCGALDYQLAYDGNFRFGWEGSWVMAPRKIPVGALTHAAVVVEAGQAIIYVDGLEFTRGPFSFRQTPTGAPLTIGAAGTCRLQLPGMVDDVRIYRTALSGAEVGVLATSRRVPVITWSPVAQIPYGTPLDLASHLNATADVPGSFQYSETLGAVLLPGTHELWAGFAPADARGVTGAEAVAVIEVTGEVPPPPGFEEFRTNRSSPQLLEYLEELHAPHAFAAGIDTRRDVAYLAVPGGGDGDGSIAVLDATATVLARIEPDFVRYGRPRATAVDVRRERLYVSNAFNASVWVFSLPDHRFLEVIEVPWAGQGNAIGVDPESGLVYAVLEGAVGIINPLLPPGPGRAVVHDLWGGGSSPGAVAFDAGPGRVYVAFGDHLVVLQSGQVVDQIDLPNTVLDIAIDPRTHRVYVATYYFGVFVLDGNPARPLSLIEGFPLGVQPFVEQMTPTSLALNPATGVLYVVVADPDQNSPDVRLSAFDVTTEEQLSRVTVPGVAGANVRVNAATGLLFVNAWYGTVSVFRDLVEQTVTTVSEPGEPALLETAAVSISIPAIGASGAQATVRQLSVSELTVPLPNTYSLDGALLYEISVVAEGSTGPYDVCFNAWAVVDSAAFNDLRVLHATNGVWVDTTISRDIATRTVCGRVASFSPFAVVRRPHIDPAADVGALEAFVTSAMNGRPGLATSMSKKLKEARRQLALGATAVAANLLGAFLNEATALLRSGRAPAPLAEALRWADSIRRSLLPIP